LHRLNHLGGSLDPHASFLLHRGVKTLALRVRQQNQSAFKLAHFLERHPAVERVNYPGLETHPQHGIARSLFEGFGGMLSFELKEGAKGAAQFLSRAQIPIPAPSLGSVETLMTLPSKTSHAGLSPEERRAGGISDGLIRISVGIESTEDLLEDFQQALG
jgi:cystathionine beta-lyase/cystathionine gamma-synthase